MVLVITPELPVHTAVQQEVALVITPELPSGRPARDGQTAVLTIPSGLQRRQGEGEQREVHVR